MILQCSPFLDARFLIQRHQARAVTAADLDGKPMATLYPDHPTSTDTIAAFAEMGARLTGRFETVYFIPMFTYIERGLAYAIVDLFSAESYRLYKEGPHRIAFRPFRPVVNLVATIMSPAYRPASNVAQAFIWRGPQKSGNSIDSGAPGQRSAPLKSNLISIACNLALQGEKGPRMSPMSTHSGIITNLMQVAENTPDSVSFDAIAALAAGQITYENSLAIAIGSNVGTTVTAKVQNA